MSVAGVDGLKTRTSGPKSGAAGVAAVAGTIANASRAKERAGFMITLFGFAECLVFVRLLEDEEGFFFYALVGDQALAVDVVLQAGVDTAGRAEVHEEPGTGAAKLGDFVVHCDLMVVDFGLVLLGPERGVRVASGRVVARFGVASPLGHDEGFLVADVPRGGVGAFGVLLVPADVFVGTDHIEGFAQGVVDDFGGAMAVGILLGTDEERGGDEAGGVELMGQVGHGGEVF